MDNYLSHRWPGSVSAPVRVETKKEKKARKKAEKRARKEEKRRARKHPVLRVLLIILLILVLLAGLGVGSWFLAQQLIPMWMESSVGETPQVSHPPISESDAPAPTLSVPRAEVGLGVTLTIEEEAGETLTAPEIYEKVLPSVVNVSAYKGEEAGYGGGSGVIMRSDGYIITNYHIIENSSEVMVTLLEDSSYYPARLVGYDVEQDIAILKIEAEGLTAAEFGDSDDLHVGDPAYAIGNPLGLDGTMTSGIVSYLNRPQTVSGYEMTLIQTSVILNSGNSGGALVNQSGQVVGITVAKLSGSISGSAMAEGIGFAIPISAARPYIDRILATGESWKPTIGITCYAGEADGVAGIMVATVDAGTPAARAGLKPMDFITHANGIPVDSVYALKRVLGEVGVGGTLTCTVMRGVKTMEISFALIDSSQLTQ